MLKFREEGVYYIGLTENMFEDHWYQHREIHSNMTVKTIQQSYKKDLELKKRGINRCYILPLHVYMDRTDVIYV